MPEFLNLVPPRAALEQLLAALPARPGKLEVVETLEALGRVTAEDILAPEDLPGFPRSTVDGYAVRAPDTFGASDSLPAYLSLAGEVPMGAAPVFNLSPHQAALVYTGGMIPDGADAVVMVENTQVSRPGELEVLRAVAPAENILRPGEDAACGNLVIPAGTKIRPAEIGGLMALGKIRVQVVAKPRVGILSSGDEVIPPDRHPMPGQVRDVNSYALAGLIQVEGGLPAIYGIIPDRPDLLERALATALAECDMVVLTAGSSASARDLTSQAIEKAGSPGILVHGVNVRPGKPTILAVCADKPVIGLPGNPVSALVIAGLFVVPVIHRLLGMRQSPRISRVSARLSLNLSSQAGREDWVPVRLVKYPDGFKADPIFYKSNLILSLVRADGLICIPEDATGLAAGDFVEVTTLT